MGSQSDLPVMQQAADVLAEFGVESDVRVASAHRAPALVEEIVGQARDRGIEVVIAGAGLAAHLPGVCASHTTLPVIGVPLKGGALHGVDSLYAVVQMPKGIPVATVAVDGAHNAGLLALQVLAGRDEAIADQLIAHRARMAEQVAAVDEEVRATTGARTVQHV